MSDGPVVRLTYPPDLDEASERTVASRRKTSNSRGPGQEGTVHFRAEGLKDCPDGCGARVPTTTKPGRHAPHWRADGVRVNCRGKETNERRDEGAD